MMATACSPARLRGTDAGTMAAPSPRSARSASANGVLASMSENRVFSLSAEGVANQSGLLRGATWSEALAAWSREGGALSQVRLEATAEDDFARGQSDRLSADTNGRLVGDLQVHLRGGTAPIAGMARAPGVDPRAVTTLGPDRWMEFDVHGNR